MNERVDVDRCPLCGSVEATRTFEEPPYSVMRCACGMVWVTPRLSETGLRRVYDEGYWSSESPKSRGYADYRRDEPLYLKTFGKRLASIRDDLGPPGRLLDVGCAAGFFMKVAADAGWEVHGVEVSSEIAGHARERFGFDSVHVGTLDTAPFEPASFDVVTMWDVVEHVPDPIALLRRARELLRPGGRLVIETQNVDSGFARLLGRRWHHYEHAEHLFHFSPTTIRELTGRAGFDVVRLTRRRAGKYVSVGFITERSARIHPALARVLSPLGRLERANLFVNLGDEMIVIGRRT